MTSGESLDFELAHKLLDYDPDTGIFKWKITRRGIPAGKIVGNVQKPEKSRRAPRVRIFVAGRSYLAHRLAWFMHYGEWPETEIDHIDGDGSNNRIENLRRATSTQNKLNTPVRSDNTSSAKGVYFHKRSGKWRVFTWVNKQYFGLGGYEKLEDAIAARDAFCITAHGEFFKEATCSRL